MKAVRSAARASVASLLLLALGCAARADELPTSITAPAPTEAELTLVDEELDELEKNEPDNCRQSCAWRLTSTIDLSPYFFPRADMRVASATFVRLRAVRPAALQRIGARLLPALRASVELERKIVHDGRHYIAAHHEHLLVVLIDLNAVELLPLLLEALVEADRLGMPLARLQVLPTITGILRQEGYRPLLESELERRHREGLAAFWEAQRARDPQAIARAQEHGNTDPVHGLPQRYARPVVMVELTPALRGQIEAWARDFLATTPVEGRRGAAAMIPKPVNR